MERKILLNPGPSTTTQTVKMAQIVEDICPREEEFGDLMLEMSHDLVRIVHGDLGKYSAVLFCGSGTINIDVCLNSLLPADKKILVVNNGVYSSRAVQVCKAYGLNHIDLRFPVDELPDLLQVEQTLRENPDIAMVYTVHNETGTGILNPIQEIGALAHRYGAIFVVDTTSTYAMIPIDIEQSNVDFLMASAQKGLTSMTGLSFIIGNTALIEESKNYPIRSYYCNLYQQYHAFLSSGQMQFTPPVQTIYATRQAIREYFAEGEEEKWARHTRVFEAIHKGIAALGFRDFIKRELQAGLVVTVLYPTDKNWDFKRIHDYCYARGYTIYPGKVGDVASFRLCALGAIDKADIEAFFVVLEAALHEINVTIPVQYE